MPLGGLNKAGRGSSRETDCLPGGPIATYKCPLPQVNEVSQFPSTRPHLMSGVRGKVLALPPIDVFELLVPPE